ncbi:response regulator transcription factor [Desulfuribacillus alkaliarsenatis]|uniref:DNA-binding response regulator n=1 Tax=Desulfuribacillus alkaliarsenatis TaxID=766136 RepID=A0A1E5G0T0_9FIRM|nr:response regulator transcription factor [Desulfuribacillus alkaliarsenatis]OEF96471.1 hypothetical protein BHF68_07380 [Desulfuribacillus alkaliarsenatis]
MAIKILVVDDHTVLRSGLVMLLNAQTDMEVVGEAGCSSEARKKIENLEPEIVLLDINLPDMNGMKLAEELIAENGHLKILFLTMHDEPEYVGRVLQIGAAGYILKSAADQELLNAIRAVYNGEFVLYKGLKENIAQQVRKRTKGTEKLVEAQLTTREQEVLRYVALGYTHQEIANKLFLSVKTVETHKAHIMEKMKTKKRSDLVKYALNNEIIKSGDQ